MKKLISVLCLCGILCTLTGCDIPFLKKNENDTPSEPGDWTTSNVVVTPQLYTMSTFVTRLYSNAGYDYSYEYPIDGEEVLDAYVADLGINWIGVLKILGSESPGGDPIILSLCQKVGINPSEIDWSTYSTLENLPNMTPAPPKSANLTEERDIFRDFMQAGGMNEYRQAIIDAGGSIPNTGAIDASIFAECLNPDVNRTYIMEHYPTQYDASLPDLLTFRIAERSSDFYVYGTRNGFSHIAYYPGVSYPKNVGKYLRDYDGKTKIPLWQEYFIAYATWCQSTYGVLLQNGIYNTTNDGIEVWWPTNDGNSLELDVYESGLIRILRSADDRMSEYDTSNNHSYNAGVPEGMYDWGESKYGLSATDVNTLYNLARIFELECATSKDLEDWEDAASVYASGLHVIGTTGAYTNFTSGDVIKCLIRFVQLKDETFKFEYSSALDAQRLADTTVQEMVANKEVIDSLLRSRGASNSTVQIAHLNATTSRVQYVRPNDERLPTYRAKYEALVEDELTAWTLEKWVPTVMGYSCVKYAHDEDWSSIDFDVFAPLIDRLGQINIRSTDTFAEYFEKLQELSTYERGDIVYTAVYNISEIPDSVRHVYIHDGTSMSEAERVVNELKQAIGSSYGGAAEILKIFEQKNAEVGDNTSSGNNSGGNPTIHW